MIRIETIKEQRRTLDWVLWLLSGLPVDRTRAYNESDVYGLKNTIRSYLNEFTYIRRNSRQQLSVTHHIVETDDGFTIKTLNDVPHLTIKFVKE